MKVIKTALFSLIAFILCCQNSNDYLIKVYEGEFDEIGVKSGYINLRGDTVIALGKYYYCYTDTLKNFAVVKKHDGTCIGIDKNDNELYEVYWYDNGPDYIVDGLFRIIKNNKIGYANEDGAIIIPPQFECATPFENGKAQVTYNCELVKDGEHTKMESDSWFLIDTKGNKIKE
ncbi:MAG: WG repeat-containing protein [Saprospiraceae bacterium]|nr:WG repeat-containing protein [Saprospiraceae bacterium]